MAMKPNQFYSVVLRKKIMIPVDKIKEVIRKGRRFAVGKYNAKGKEYEAWKVLGLAKSFKPKKVVKKVVKKVIKKVIKKIKKKK